MPLVEFGIGGREKRPLGFFIVLALEGEVGADQTGLGGGRTAVTQGKPALNVGEGGKRIVFAFQDTRCAVDPAPTRHVGNCVLIADDILPAFKMIVEHTVMPLGLLAIPVCGIRRLICRSVLEMHSLPGKDPEFQQTIADVLVEVERFFLRCVRSGQQAGTISTAQSPEDLSQLLLGIHLAIRVMARVRPERQLMEGLLRPVFSLFDVPSIKSELT